MKRIMRMICMMAFVIGVFSCFNTVLCNAESYEVAVNESDFNDGFKVQEYLNLQRGETPKYDMLTVTIEPGTYYLYASLCVYSNTTIVATGATIYYVRRSGDGAAPAIFNDAAGVYKYNGASNITVDGGIWDLQGAKGQEMYGKRLEGFRFMHCKNITVKNLTMRNMYTTHMLTIEGVDTATVTNCTFKDQVAIKQKKEAIHIDCMHNDAIAPSSQGNVKYDETFTNNLTVDSCTFINVPRGVGTHIAIEGSYPDNMVITNNTFKNITYEAIKAFCYKNYVIKGNTIDKCGLGIKAYNYVSDSESDGDSAEGKAYQKPVTGVIKEKNPKTFNGLIEDNTISNVKSSLGFGIHLQGTKKRVYSGIIVRNNTINTTKSIGIYVKDCADIEIDNNKLSSIGDIGIDVTTTPNANVHDNTIGATKSLGIYVNGGKKVKLVHNTNKSAKKQNIYAMKSPNILIKDNEVSSGKTGGIFIVKGCNNAKIYHNTIANAGKNGLGVMEVSKADVYNNTVTSPKNFGLYIYKTKKTKVRTNTVKNAKKSGIVIHQTTSTNVSGSTIVKTGDYGILFSGTKTSKALKGNKIKKCKNYKICYALSCKNRGKNVK